MRIRQCILAIPVVLATGLSGCATMGGGGASPDPQTIDDIAKQVEAFTASVCSFQPTASALLGLIGAFYQPGVPLITIANQIGQAICSAPLTQTASRRAGASCPAHVVVTPNGTQIVVPDRRCVAAKRH